MIVTNRVEVCVIDPAHVVCILRPAATEVSRHPTGDWAAIVMLTGYHNGEQDLQNESQYVRRVNAVLQCDVYQQQDVHGYVYTFLLEQ